MVTYSNRAADAWREFTRRRHAGELLIDGRQAFTFSFVGQILLGTEAGAKGFEKLLTERGRRDLELPSSITAPCPRLLWLHTVPRTTRSLYELIMARGGAVVFEEIVTAETAPPDPRDPFTELARRLIEHPLWGSASRRARLVLKLVEQNRIDGVVHFNHWGCRQGMGSLPVLRDALSRAGVPFLAVDGDALTTNPAPAIPSPSARWRASWRCSRSPFRSEALTAAAARLRALSAMLTATPGHAGRTGARPMSETERTLAVFIDFENLAIGFKRRRGDFDIQKILERLLEKGKVIVRKARADWNEYKQYTRPLHEAAIELIKIPRRSMTGKNSADIRLAVDAMDLAWSKEHIDTFVIVSGDSDFSPLVSKLKENGKHIIGIGMRDSTSDLLAQNCDEFIFYEDLEKAPAVVPAAAVPADVPRRRRKCSTCSSSPSRR